MLALTLVCCSPPNSRSHEVAAPPLALSQAFYISRVPECYSLAYSDPVKGATARLFPIWVAIFPGKETGAASGRHHPALSDLDWLNVSKYAAWKRTSADSIEVMFGGNYEAISIHVSRTGSNLVGRATWLSDVLESGVKPSMRVVGSQETCPNNVSPASSGMLRPL
jgi:hypothetical protein